MTRNVIIRWQISKSVKVVMCIFAQDLTASGILTFQFVYLQKVGQGHGVQFLQ